MSSYSRPIVGETASGVGIKYINLSGHSSRTNIHVDAIGTVTFTVDSSIDKIYWDATALTAVNLQPNNEAWTAPASAFWVNEIASGTADADVQLNAPVNSLRINITAGTGSVGYRIQQT